MDNKIRMVFATNNPHKLEEARAILGKYLDIVSLAEIGCHDDIPETSDSLQGNALIKARWVRDKYGVDCFADDTGLMVDALGGAPGVYSARYAGPDCTPDDNIDKLLAEMKDKHSRKAHFSTVVALARNGAEHTFEGRVEGSIASERHGEGGFGYDPIFIPDETGISFAEMAPEAKNAISHRGRALDALRRFLAPVLIIIASLAGFSPALASEWRLHPSFDGQVIRIIDSSDFTYFLGTAQQYERGHTQKGRLYGTLFRRSKSEGDMEWMSTRSGLSGNMVSAIGYNRQKKYLVVAFDDGNVDIVYESGAVKNVPGIKLADAALTKRVNDIQTSDDGSKIILATAFGYVIIDEASGQVLSSRDFHKNVQTASLFRGKVWLGTAEGLFYGDEREFDFNNFKRLGEITNVHRFENLGSDWLYLLFGDNKWTEVRRVKLHDGMGDFALYPFCSGKQTGIETTAGGEILLVSPSMLRLYNAACEVKEIAPPAEAAGATASTADGSVFWFSLGRKGVTALAKPTDGSANWTGKVAPVIPNASNAFFCTAMAYHPEFGMLVRNHGFDFIFNAGNFNIFDTPDLISAYKNMEWTPMSAIYRVDMKGLGFDNPSGLAIDPLNTDHVYAGSARTGLLRLDLRNPEKSLHMSKPSDMTGGNGQPGFVTIIPDNDPGYGWAQQASFSEPQFDAEGRLWSVFAPAKVPKATDVELWWWTPEDRAASTSASNFRPWKKMTVTGASYANSNNLLVLKSAANKNRIIINPGINTAPITVLDHNGTPENTSDDRKAFLKNLYDEDGLKVTFDNLYCLYEDPATGLIWVGYNGGVFTFSTSKAFEDPTTVSQIKVSRNDGTNLADHLLAGVPVNCIISDASGRKWFATNGAGLVCTTAPGTTVLNSYTTENSEIPGDIVYSVCVNPDNNSLMLATDGGLCELFLSGLQEAAGNDVKVWPNPVKPDYYGYVNIEGLPEDSFVKIVDTAGNLISECGQSFAGAVTWDISNINHRRVPGGVYFVIASNGPDLDSYAKVGKILVIE